MSDVGTVDYWKRKYEEECEIVDRCWRALGIYTYDQAGRGSKTIYDHILTLKARADAADALALPEAAQWIDAAENKPPEDADKYVLFVTSIGMWFGWRDADGKWFTSFDDEIVCYDADVTHWMPAPAAPVRAPQERNGEPT